MPNVTGIWWVDITIVTSVFLAAIAGIWQKGVRPVAHWVRDSYRDAQHAVEIGSNLVKLSAVTEAVLQEFHPNGGGSLRDAIDGMDTKVDRIEQAATDAATKAEEVAKALQHETKRLASALAEKVESTAEPLAQKQADLLGRVEVLAVDVRRIDKAQRALAESEQAKAQVVLAGVHAESTKEETL